MKFRHWRACCALLVGLAGATSAVAVTVGDQSPTPPQSSDSATCNRAIGAQLAEVQGLFNLIRTQLDNISDPQAAKAGRNATESIELALSSGCLDQISAGFSDLKEQPLGSSDAAYQIWKVANEILAKIAGYQFAPDRIEAIEIAAAQDVVSRWQHPPTEAADFYLDAVGAYLQAGLLTKNPKAFDRALTIARERVLPLADRQTTPYLWFRAHFLMGDILYEKTNMLEPGETPGSVAEQSIAATQSALLVDVPDDELLFGAHMNLALAHSAASWAAGFKDQSLDDRTAAAIGKVLSDSRLTVDKPQWGFLHDAYAKAVISRATPMQNPERARRMSDALAVVERALGKMNRDSNLLVWARLQDDRAVAAAELAIGQRDKNEALRNLDLAIASYETILAVKEQIASGGDPDLVARVQPQYRQLLAIKAQIASATAQPTRSQK